MASRVQKPELRTVFREQVVNAIEVAPLAAAADYFKTSTVLAAQTTTLLAASMTASVAINLPVVPVLVLTNDIATGETKWTSVSATVVGIDQFGTRNTETVAAVDASPTWTATFNHAYCSLISVAWTVTGGTAADGSDTYTIGYAKTYGLGCAIQDSSDVLISTFNGAADAGTISNVFHTYTIAGTPDAAKLFALYVRSKAPTS